MAATKKQIQAWKEEYGGVFRLPVDDKIAYLREPNMVDYKRAFSQMQKNGEVAFGEEMLKCLFIGGDEAIKTDDAYFLPARKELTDFFNYQDAEIIKLKQNQNEIIIGESRCVVRKINRADLKMAEKKNPSSKPFVTQEKLFDIVKVEVDDVFNNRNDAKIRFPLYQAIEKLQNEKTAILEKL